MADAKTYDIPETGKAGVVYNEGPDFKLEVEDVPVPEPGKHIEHQLRILLSDIQTQAQTTSS
jgi:hypothetical protein